MKEFPPPLDSLVGHPKAVLHEPPLIHIMQSRAMESPVFPHIRSLAETFAADIADIGLFSCMDTLMDHECVGAFERLATNIARETPLPCVDHAVLISILNKIIRALYEVLRKLSHHNLDKGKASLRSACVGAESTAGGWGSSGSTFRTGRLSPPCVASNVPSASYFLHTGPHTLHKLMMRTCPLPSCSQQIPLKHLTLLCDFSCAPLLRKVSWSTHYKCYKRTAFLLHALAFDVLPVRLWTTKRSFTFMDKPPVLVESTPVFKLPVTLLAVVWLLELVQNPMECKAFLSKERFVTLCALEQFTGTSVGLPCPLVIELPATDSANETFRTFHSQETFLVCSMIIHVTDCFASISSEAGNIVGTAILVRALRATVTKALKNVNQPIFGDGELEELLPGPGVLGIDTCWNRTSKRDHFAPCRICAHKCNIGDITHGGNQPKTWAKIYNTQMEKCSFVSIGDNTSIENHQHKWLSSTFNWQSNGRSRWLWNLLLNASKALSGYIQTVTESPVSLFNTILTVSADSSISRDDLG
uniref:Uncharacterized protein n=1 Tax=Timema poppense TaxID=170557 RepID=A0A7R9H1W4_TIMPO|nr:unnamed protein product [Timema poppensis]